MIINKDKDSSIPYLKSFLRKHKDLVRNLHFEKGHSIQTILNSMNGVI